MIEKRFWLYPQILWITLWASWAIRTQVLDSRYIRRRCSISRQRVLLNKIKDLAASRPSPDGSSAACATFALKHDFWG
jgi:hypothetical protein